MNHRFIFALLVLPVGLLAAMFVGCQQAADRQEPAAAPVQTAEASIAEQAEVGKLVSEYLELQQLLARDEFEGVPEQFAEMHATALPIAEAGNVELQPQARAVAEQASARPQNIKEARQAFKAISAALVEMLEFAPAQRELEQPLYVAYCPMAKAPWLQASEELANPYMGQEMPKCGEIQQTIQPASA